MRRCMERQEDPTCFTCPLHNPASKLSLYAIAAFVHACQVAATVRAWAIVTVVWEARAVEGQGPFDLWFYEYKVLIEVDGEQHVEGRFQSTGADEQTMLDRAKEAAAIDAGFHVVRLHYRDVHVFQAKLLEVLLRAMAGAPPTVYFTLSYPLTFLV